MKKKIEKFEVCRDCLSPEIVDADCVCVYARNYDTIQLEFETCACCGHLTDSEPVDNDFNNEQFRKFNEEHPDSWYAKHAKKLENDEKSN